MTIRTTSTPTVTAVDAVRMAARRVGDAWTGMINQVATTFSRQALDRRVIYRLSVLSERELADIGLTSSDVADAALSENGDATRLLLARRDARRAARHGRYPF